ncbi:HAD superfamily hydrolase (TIGR01509 family) [Rhizobium sp. BK251]|nr:HAD superfamily hydrolase (TIGR01509 family) [Rhizobium sp. BK251]
MAGQSLKVTTPETTAKHTGSRIVTIELVIFDCDGVLIDSEPVSSRVLWQSLQRAGVEISHAEVHRRFTGHSESDARQICVEELGLTETTRVFAESRANLYEEFARSLTPMPGIEALVRALPHKKCVASNSSMERLTRSLGLLSLWNEFAPNVFSAEMVERPKPAPDLFLMCATRLGVEPDRCVVIDDSPHGIAGAAAAGMKSIGFVDPADPREGQRSLLADAGATLVVRGIAELGQALDTLLSSEPSPCSGRETSFVTTPA